VYHSVFRSLKFFFSGNVRCLRSVIRTESSKKRPVSHTHLHLHRFPFTALILVFTCITLVIFHFINGQMCDKYSHVITCKLIYISKSLWVLFLYCVACERTIFGGPSYSTPRPIFSSATKKHLWCVRLPAVSYRAVNVKMISRRYTKQTLCVAAEFNIAASTGALSYFGRRWWICTTPGDCSFVHVLAVGWVRVCIITQLLNIRLASQAESRRHNATGTPSWCTVCGKKVSAKVVCYFLSNHLEFLRDILHVYYLFIYT